MIFQGIVFLVRLIFLVAERKAGAQKGPPGPRRGRRPGATGRRWTTSGSRRRCLRRKNAADWPQQLGGALPGNRGSDVRSRERSTDRLRSVCSIFLAPLPATQTAGQGGRGAGARARPPAADRLCWVGDGEGRLALFLPPLRVVTATCLPVEGVWVLSRPTGKVRGELYLSCWGEPPYVVDPAYARRMVGLSRVPWAPVR